MLRPMKASKSGPLDGAQAPRPATDTTATTCEWINLTGLAAFFCSLYMTRDATWDVATKVIAVLALPAATLSTLEAVYLQNWRKSGLDFTTWRPQLCTAVSKLVGFAATLAAVGLAYWVFPEYHGDFYVNYFSLIRCYGPYALVICCLYICLADCAALDKTASMYYRLGQLVIARRNLATAQQWTQHALAWTVKGFFIPLMLSYFMIDMVKFQSVVDGVLSSFWASELTFMQGYTFIYDTLYLVDLGFVSMGYTLSADLLDNQIRSTEPTLLGWVSAIMCYQPFYSVVGTSYLAYDTTSRKWDLLWQDYPFLLRLWGTAILLLLGVYVYATVCFSLRFSNLTNRGIITIGPYRWARHPAYISKNLTWWLICVPFTVPGGWQVRAQQCLMLACVNFMYYVRAKTEERHLLADPAYQAYYASFAQRSSKVKGILLPKARKDDSAEVVSSA